MLHANNLQDLLPNVEQAKAEFKKQREEAIRQFEAQMAYQKERDKVADEKWQKEYNLQKKTVNYLKHHLALICSKKYIRLM